MPKYTILSLVSTASNTGHSADLYYFKNTNGLEIDLILDRARTLHLFEIKSAMTPDESFARHLRRFTGAIPAAASSAVIYAGEDWPGTKGVPFMNFKKTEQLISEKTECGFEIRPVGTLGAKVL